MTVGELLTRMTSSEMTEWRGYFSILAAEGKQSSGHPDLL